MNNPIRFVSLGPGDAELITLKALRALQQAEIIFCPATTTMSGQTLSRAAGLLHELDIHDSIQLFNLPMSKDRTKALAVYDCVYKEIQKEYREGKRIAVAVEGDAGIYASIHYVMDELQAEEIPTEQYCGIPSFIAAGAAARLHLISQEDKLVVIPGSVTLEELDNYLYSNHVPVIMKLSHCTDTVHEYMKQYPECAYHYFENVSTEQEYYSCNQEELKEKAFPYFSLMIIFRPTRELTRE